MMRAAKLSAMILAIVILPTQMAAGSPKAGEATETKASESTRVEYWDLWQHTGAELYGEMCASCHGVDAEGDGPALDDLAVPAPALRYLEQSGVPKSHWAYVLRSACGDSHHRALDGTATMPCWGRAFRQALGSEAGPMMVTKKLTEYLASIQE